MRLSAVLLLFAVACSGSSPAPVVPPKRVPRLEVTPAAVAFGRITAPASRQLMVRNVGDTGSELVVQPPRLVSSDFTVSEELVVTATATSTGFKTAELVVESNGGTVRVVLTADIVPLEGCEFQVSPPRIDFGAVSTPHTAPVTVRNSSIAACEISDVTVEGSTVFSVPSGQLPLMVLPGEEKTLQVAVTPGMTGGQHLGVLHLGSKRVELVATVQVACLTITPNDLDFGTVKERCMSPRRTFSVYNTCAPPVTVVSFGMLASAGVPGGSPGCPGTARCPEFVMDGSPSFTAGSQISPGSNPATFSLRYQPLDFGPDTGAFQLRVTQNGQVVDYIVTLRGAGDTFGQNTDTFRVDRRPVADVVVVLDDSASMGPLRASVAQNIDLLAEYVLRGSIDVQLGLTTTGSDAGLLGPVVTDRTPMGRAVLAQQLALVGTSGPTVPPLIATGLAAAPALVRDGGVLSIITVSNLDDGSPDTVAAYVAQLHGLKALSSFSAIGPEPDAGQPRSHAAVAATGGVTADVSWSDWNLAFRPLTGDPFGPRTKFYLTAVPVLGSLVVRIDGVVQPAGSWTYDATSNAVDFPPSTTLEGAVITATYDVTCS